MIKNSIVEGISSDITASIPFRKLVNEATENAAGTNRGRLPGLGTGFAKNLTALHVLLLSIGLASFQTLLAGVIDPTGASYTQVSASSEFNGSYVAANLFNYDVSSTVAGNVLPDASEWAISGPPLTNAYVAFDLGAVHTASSMFYAQRNSGNPPTDMMDIAQIWASQTSAFDPNNPPVTAPDTVVTITNHSSRVWTEYFFYQ